MNRFLLHVLLTAVIILCAVNLFAADCNDKWYGFDKRLHFWGGATIQTACEFAASPYYSKWERHLYCGLLTESALVLKEALDATDKANHFCFKDLAYGNAGMFLGMGLSHVFIGSHVSIDLNHAPKMVAVTLKF